jgi:hypothetical protein
MSVMRCGMQSRRLSEWTAKPRRAATARRGERICNIRCASWPTRAEIIEE